MEQLRFNTFSGESNGTSFTLANSGGGGHGFSALTWAGGSAQYNTAPPWGGSDTALRITLGGGGQIYVRWDLYATANRRVVARRPFFVQTLPTVNAGYIISMYSEVGRKAALVLETTGRLILSNAAGSFVPATRSSITLSSNTLYWLELAVTSGTTTSNGQAEYVVYAADGVTQLDTYSTGSAFNTTTSVEETQVRIGGMNANDSGWTYEWLDNVKAAVLDTGWLGPDVDMIILNASADKINPEPYSTVALSASAFGVVSSWQWTQISGTSVVIQDATSQYASFVVPPGFSDTTLEFQVSANDGEATDTVAVSVPFHTDWMAGPSGEWLPARRQSIG